MKANDNVAEFTTGDDQQTVDTRDALDALLGEKIVAPVDVSDIYGKPIQLYVRAIATADYERWQLEAVKVAKNSNAFRELKGKLVLRALSLADGRAVLDINDPKDNDRVKRMPMPVLERLFSKAQDINGMDKAKIEDAEKNSESDLM